MRARRVWVQTMLAAFSALLAAAITVPVTEVSSYIPHLVADNRWLWFGLLTGIAVAMTVTAGLPVWLEKTVPSEGFVGVPVTPGWIDRSELPGLVKALTAAGSEPVALTTGLVGAGGFGKTMLAARACRDRAVRRSFGGRVVWITVGQDLCGAALAARISETIRNLGHDIPPFTGPEQAGQALAETLGEARTLLVADDVWSADQLKPFLTAGQAGRLLVTTRRPALLARAGAAHQIKVDTVTGEVARQMLAYKLPKPAASSQWTQELLDLTGGWPLLLSLVNHRLAEDVTSGAVLDRAAADAVNRLRQAGPTALDLDDLKIRESAVAATIDYSLDVLKPPDRIRFLELGIFAEDAEIPLDTVALLWRGAAGLSEIAAQSLCERLQGLSLLSLAYAGEVKVVILHDVIRDFAVRRLGPARCTAAHAGLIAAARELTGPAPSAQWWRLPQTAGAGYLWPNLTYHLQAAGLESELDQLCCDLRFLAVRLRNAGPAEAVADLARSATPTAGRLRHAISQNAGLLAPLEPPAALTTTLTSRLGDVPGLAGQLPVLRRDLHAWTAWPAWRPPDLPSDEPVPSPGRTGWVSAMAVARDGSWLATAHYDKMARTWTADGAPLACLSGHQAWVRAVAIAPDGSWLATASDDNTVRTWTADGTPRATLAGHTAGLTSVAISPDGAWLASGSWDNTVRTWAADGTPLATLAGHTAGVLAVAISPDGTWLATGSDDNTVRTWGADGTPRATLTGHTAGVLAVAISPDGTWLATGSGDNTLRVWAPDAAGTDVRSVTAIRIDGAVWACGWLPGGTDICIGGNAGLYRFALRPAGG